MSQTTESTQSFLFFSTFTRQPNRRYCKSNKIETHRLLNWEISQLKHITKQQTTWNSTAFFLTLHFSATKQRVNAITKSKPVNIEARLSVKELGKLLSHSPNRIAHVHIVILLLFLFFARLRTSLHWCWKLAIQPHILIQFRHLHRTIFNSGANPDRRPRLNPKFLIVRQDFKPFKARVRVTKDSGYFWWRNENHHWKISAQSDFKA